MRRLKMKEAITNAVEELKRVDHLIYVSLKYTRTVDVIRSVINRLIESYNAIIDGFLEQLEQENKIIDIPLAPLIRVKMIKENINDEILNEGLDFYIYLRKLYCAEYTSSGEFRKKVMMSSNVEGQIIEIKMDTVLEFYQKTKIFIHHINDNYLIKDD
jgi:hypothetical protein